VLTQDELQQVLMAVAAVGTAQPPPTELARQLTLEEDVSSFTIAGGTITTNGDANRVLLGFSVTAGITIYCTTTGVGGVGRGLSVNGSFGPLLIQVGDHGVMPQLVWTVFVPAGTACTVTILKLTWRPQT
jgi:hypothetical protein